MTSSYDLFRQVSAYVATVIFVVLLAVVVYTLIKKNFTNRYIRFAFVELTIALTIRAISCLMYGLNEDNEELDNRLFDVLLL